MGVARRGGRRLRGVWARESFCGRSTGRVTGRGALTNGRVPPFVFLPVALPICVWMIRTFSADARGHGTEAVIAAVHQRSGRVDWLVAPVKLSATVMTLAFGGSVGKEGPAAQIGAALTSLFADILRLRDEDRRRLVICGHQRRLRGGVRDPGLRSTLRHRGVVSRTDRLHRHFFPRLSPASSRTWSAVSGRRFRRFMRPFADTHQTKTILIMLACGRAVRLESRCC